MGVCGQYVLMQTLFMNRIEDFMKKIFRQIHLWLSVPFGLIISLICFSGAMLVFENEVMELVRHELYLDVLQKLILMKTNMPYFPLIFY
jgi:hypothetical protein